MSLIVTEKVITGFAIIFNAIKEGSMAVVISDCIDLLPNKSSISKNKNKTQTER